MDIAGAFSYAAEIIDRLAASSTTYLVGAVLVLVVVGSFVLGEEGAKLRASLGRVFAFTLFGCIAAVVVISVKGLPEAAPEAAKPPETSSAQRLQAWLDAARRHDAASPDSRAAAPAPRAESPARPGAAAPHAVSADPRKLAGNLLRTRNIVIARTEFMRVRAEVARMPEQARTPEHRRRDAEAEKSLAELDRDEGRIRVALDRYHRARAALARLGDAGAQRAAVAVSLDIADTLDTRNDVIGARAAYRSAIDAHRGLTTVGEAERREGVADALVRYARFETSHRQEVPARAALDEADGHYVFLRAQRGTFQVLRARVDLGLATGNIDGARQSLAALRALVLTPGLADLSPQVDMAEARIALAEGRAAEAEALFMRAIEAHPANNDDIRQRRSLANAFMGRAEAAFMAKRIDMGRASAAAALAIRRALGDQAHIVGGFAQLALWEAGAGDNDTARAAFDLALAVHRETGEPRAAADAEAIFQILCSGALRGSGSCRTYQALRAAESGP